MGGALADTVTFTKNEILYSLNRPEDFILAIVEFIDGDSHCSQCPSVSLSKEGRILG